MKKKKGKFNKKNFDKPKKTFQNRSASSGPTATADLENISMDSAGKNFAITGIVDRIVQTGGPTVFHITDGTGTLALKAFEGAGVRAYSEVNEGDTITADVKIEEYRGEIEGEVTKLSKLSGKELETFNEKIKENERNRASITPPPFLVESIILEKLKDSFTKAATEIRLAIIQNRPIIIRHHNDADGYSSGYALEKAILPLIDKQHGPGKATWEYFTRAPCAAPFYEIDDSIRDTSRSLSNAAKFSNKMPLVIIADNGSSPEDLLAISQGKVHGIDFIVIDHHFFDEDVISKQVLVHINPFLVEEDGAKFSAGMLCTELARFINPDVKNIEQIPAMAGIADRIDNPEAISDYLKLANEHDYSESLLSNISTVIDFVSAKLRFMEAREYIEVIFGEPMSKQKALVNLLAPYIKDLEAKGLKLAKSTAELEKVGPTTLQLLDIESTFPRGFYPKPGKSTGLVHDDLQESNNLKNVVSAGVLSDAITMRATDEANFSVHDLITFLNEKLPEAFVEGGGHKNAGAIKFVPHKKDKVVSLLKEFIKTR
jgi:archaea-specific RecJ-like exonuclease